MCPRYRKPDAIFKLIKRFQHLGPACGSWDCVERCRFDGSCGLLVPRRGSRGWSGREGPSPRPGLGRQVAQHPGRPHAIWRSRWIFGSVAGIAALVSSLYRGVGAGGAALSSLEQKSRPMRVRLFHHAGPSAVRRFLRQTCSARFSASASFKSASTMILTSSLKRTLGSQPSWRLALAGSPMRSSTSAGRS